MANIDLNDEKDPVAAVIRKELEKLDGKEVAKKFGPDGEVAILMIDGKQVEVPLEVDNLRKAPKGFGSTHHDALEILFSAISQVNEMGRLVPVTRNELVDQFKVHPKCLKHLERWGYIKSRIIKLVPKSEPGATKGQAIAVYYPTPQGRAYVREHFDPQYGLSGARNSERVEGGGAPDAPGSGGPVQ
jgi:hypothetical protein